MGSLDRGDFPGAPAVAFQPIVIGDSTDNDGRLVFVAERLVAVLVRLTDQLHGQDVDSWFVEAAFGPLSDSATRIFVALEQVEEWIVGIISTSQCHSVRSETTGGKTAGIQ